MAKEILIDLDLSGNKINNSIVGENAFLYTANGALSYGTNGLQINDEGVKSILHSGNISQFTNAWPLSGSANLLDDVSIIGGDYSIYLSSTGDVLAEFTQHSGGYDIGTSIDDYNQTAMLSIDDTSVTLGATDVGLDIGNVFQVANENGSAPHGIYAYGNILNFRGIEYGLDFSVNYTDRSLVDKAYVVNAIASASTSGNAGNYWKLIGTNLLTGDVVVDGDNGGNHLAFLNVATFSIQSPEGAGGQISFETAESFIVTAEDGISLQTEGQIVATSTGSNVEISGQTGASMTSSNGDVILSSATGVAEVSAPQVSINASTGAISITAAQDEILLESSNDRIVITAPFGAVYADDYSAQYVDHSLVDKQYVVNALYQASTSGFSLASGSGTTAVGNAVNLGGTTTATTTIIPPSSLAHSFLMGSTSLPYQSITKTAQTASMRGMFSTSFYSDIRAAYDGSSAVTTTILSRDSTNGFSQALFNSGNGGNYSTTLETRYGTSAKWGRISVASNGPLTDSYITIGAQTASNNNVSISFNTGATNTTGLLQVSGGSTSFAGMQYAADYSANYTNRSLVDKEYVDNATGAGWTTNGTTNLTGNVEIDLGSNNLTFDGGGNIVFNTASSGGSIFFSTAQGSIVFNLDNTAVDFTIQDGRFSAKGLEYAADYSATYTDRSLVDKAYVVNAIASASTSGSGSGNFWALSGTSTLLDDVIIDGISTNVIEMINLSSFNIVVNDDAGYVFVGFDGPTSNGGLYSSTDKTNISQQDESTGDGTQIEMKSQTIIISGYYSGFTGIEYEDDYSINYTDRSLVDKGYVTNAIYQAGTAGSAPFTGSFTQIPFVNTTSTGYSYSNDLVYKTATQQFVGGNASTAPSGSLTFTYGDSNVNKGTFGSVMFGELSEIDVNVGSGFNAGENNYISAYGGHTMGRGVRATGAYSWAGGWYSPNSVFAKTNAKAVTVSGEASFGFFETNGAQTDGHGVQSNASAVLGGSNPNIPADSHRTVILGGNGIKARANDSDQVYVANFNIVSTPISGTAGYSFLVRDNTTGQVKQVASAGGGSSSVTASNGLTKIGDDIQLGGALTGATTVDVIGSNNFTYNWDNGFSSTGSVEIGGSTSVFEAQADDPSFGFSSADVRSSQVSIYHESAAETETYTLTLSDSGLDLNATYNFEDYTRLYLEASSTPGVPTLRVETFDNANAVQNAEALTIDKNGISIAVKDVTDTQVAKLEITNAVTTYHDNRVTKTGIQYAADYSTTYTNRSLVDKEYVDKAVTVDAVRYTAVANNQTASDPGTGNIKWNNATLTSATALYIDDETSSGIDISNYLSLFNTNSIIFIQKQGDSAVYQRWRVTSVTDNTGWWTYGVTLLDSAGVIAQSDKLVVALRAVTPANPMTSYKTTITGDNSTTDFVVTHALSSLDTVIQVYRNTSPFDQIVVAIERTSTNSATIKFGIAPTGSDSYRVFVIAI